MSRARGDSDSVRLRWNHWLRSCELETASRRGLRHCPRDTNDVLLCAPYMCCRQRVWPSPHRECDHDLRNANRRRQSRAILGKSQFCSAYEAVKPNSTSSVRQRYRRGPARSCHRVWGKSHLGSKKCHFHFQYSTACWPRSSVPICPQTNLPPCSYMYIAGKSRLGADATDNLFDSRTCPPQSSLRCVHQPMPEPSSDAKRPWRSRLDLHCSPIPSLDCYRGRALP